MTPVGRDGGTSGPMAPVGGSRQRLSCGGYWFTTPAGAVSILNAAASRALV